MSVASTIWAASRIPVARDLGAMSWSWDETLYAGSAVHYARGRMPYPAELGTALRDELGLDGSGRLLDVGCGPGPLTAVLAPFFSAVVGIDADAAMIAEAGRRGIGNARWLRMRAEELPAELGTFQVVSFAQSFHWMDQPLVAERVRPMLTGAWVHIGATTHRGVGGEVWDRIEELIVEYLGPVRRAGQGTLPHGTAGGEDEVMRRAGYRGPVRLEVGGGEVVERSADEVVAAVFSLSYAAPHLFGDRLPAFEADLRELLKEPIRERRREISATVWRP
jgi:SAM-dependent methyltransferase